MGLPSKLKNALLFNDGNRYLGETGEVALPKLSRKMEDWRGGGMSGPLKADMGMEGIDLEWKVGGLLSDILRQFGLETYDGAQLRFTGAYQRDDTGAVDALEIVVRGRHQEIDMGKAKTGDDTEWSIKTTCAYYKLTINGQVMIEIDFLGMIENVGGVDRMAAHRRALQI